MSHISLFEAHENRDLEYGTPVRRQRRSKGVYDFVGSTKTPKRTQNYLLLATPATRRITNDADLIAGIEEENHPGSYEVLNGRIWKTYSVSPLFGFDPQKSPRRLSYQLATHLELEGGSRGDEVLFPVEIVKGFRGNREDHDGLQITVQKRSESKPDEFKDVCKIYFLAVHSQEVHLNSRVTVLPLCLAQGPENLVQKILLIMSRQFDCVIYPLNLEPLDLKWMCALWSGTEANTAEVDENFEKHQITKLIYALPKNLQNNGVDHIDVKFTADQIRAVWNELKRTDDMEMTEEDMESFHRVLDNYLREAFRIQFDQLTLSNIVLPTLSASSSGNVQIHRIDKIKTILGFLTSLSQEKYVLKANPSLGVPMNVS